MKCWIRTVKSLQFKIFQTLQWCQARFSIIHHDFARDVDCSKLFKYIEVLIVKVCRSVDVWYILIYNLDRKDVLCYVDKMIMMMQNYQVLYKFKCFILGRGQLKYNLGRDVPLTLKSGPVFIQNFPQKWDPLFTRGTNFKNLLKISLVFQNCWSFKPFFGIRFQIKEIGPIFAPILKKKLKT